MGMTVFSGPLAFALEPGKHFCFGILTRRCRLTQVQILGALLQFCLCDPSSLFLEHRAKRLNGDIEAFVIVHLAA